MLSPIIQLNSHFFAINFQHLVLARSVFESASALLEDVQGRKSELINSGKIPKIKTLPQVQADEEQYTLPRGWVWARLGTATYIILGQSPPSLTYNEVGDGLPFYQGKADYGEIYPSPRKWCTAPKKLAETGDVLISVRAPVGPTNLCYETSCIGRGLAAIRPLTDMSSWYLLYMLRAFEDQISGTGFGTTFSAITGKDLNGIVVPIAPPLEQERIVARVDELSQQTRELADRLESADTQRKKFHTAAIHHLTEAKTPKETSAAWHLIRDNFDRLYTEPETIDELKQAILQLAVMGRLVPQDPNDEPAEVLLEQIAAKNEELFKAGTIKKQIKLPTNLELNIPYQLPHGWAWVRLGDIIINMDAGWSPQCEKHPAPDGKWGVLRTTSVQSMKFLSYENKQLPSFLDPRPKYEVNVGDILITRAGPIHRVGVSCCVIQTRPLLMISDKIIRFHSFNSVYDPTFIALALNSGYSNWFIEQKKSGMAKSQMNISQTKLRQTPLPILPLAEQKKIVGKVNELLTICDELNKYVELSKNIRANLLEVMLSIAVN